MNVSGAKAPMTLLDAEGRKHEFSLRPLTDKDIDELDLWLRSHIIETAVLAVADKAPEVRDAVLQAAVREASTATWMSPKGARIIGTLEGMVRLTWQAIEPQPATMADLRRLLTNEKQVVHNIKTANHAYKVVNDLDNSAGEGSSADRPTKKRSTKSSRQRATRRKSRRK